MQLKVMHGPLYFHFIFCPSGLLNILLRVKSHKYSYYNRHVIRNLNTVIKLFRVTPSTPRENILCNI